MNERIGWIAMLLLGLLVAAGPRAAAQEAPAEFDVRADRYVGPEFVGFGAQMNPYLFCRPNDGEVTAANVGDLEKKVVALRPQHVRVFFLNSWFATGSDPAIAKGDPRVGQSFIRTVRMAQRAGATVNVTLWYDPGQWRNPAEHARQFGVNVARMIRTEHLDAVRYVTLQNEPNGEPAKGEAKKVTLEKYEQAYRAVDAALRAQGVRDRVKIVSGDLLAREQEVWFPFLADHLADVSDGYSMHAYWDYWDTPKLVRRLDDVYGMWKKLPDDRRRPLYATEFGVRGKRENAQVEPGLYADGRAMADVPEQAVQCGWFMLGAVNRGYVGLVQWDMYQAWYDRFLPFGVIGRGKEGYPLKPGYHLLKLLTHTCEPGWRAVEVEGERTVVMVAAMKGPAGELTVWALNHGPTSRATRVRSLPAGAKLFACRWNWDGAGTLGRGGDVAVTAGGEVQLDVPPGGLVSLSTRAPAKGFVD